MAASGRHSFADRMRHISLTSNTNKTEIWDDGDFEDGLLFKSSTVASMSSRMSVRSESNTGEEDWQYIIAANDESTAKAITSAAKQAGIPIPNVPSSALLGGSIKKLGKKKSSRKLERYDDFSEDFELPLDSNVGLKLKPPTPQTPADDQIDLDWGEGSLGIRFAGTRNARGARSSSVSGMSPSLGSCMTIESEDDDLTGLVLPKEPLDFNARLEKLKNSEQLPTPDASPLPALQFRKSPPTSAPKRTSPRALPSPPITFTTPSPLQSPPLRHRASLPTKPKPVDDEEDFMDGLDFGGHDIFDSRKLKLNRNVVVKKPVAKPTPPPAARPATTITFTDRTTASRIPRPLPSTSRTRLTPVYETGASTHGHSRPMPTTTSAQLLRSKRSAPVLRNNNMAQPPRLPFLPAGSSAAQSHHVMARASQPQLRRDSDPRRPQSPSMRPYSRLSGETPSRAGVRRDLAPSALARHPPPKKLTQPQRKRNFGDGHELDLFDDLPTSAVKEKQFEKVPRNVASNKTLRQQPSYSRLPMPDRMTTPLPQTPRSPPKADHTPRFARDTAASRNAREQRLAGTRSRADGPMAPRPMSWAAQVAARSPHTSPSAHRKKGTGQKPQLIRQMTQPFTHNEKGMIYNPTMQRWEGNEEALVSFSHPNTSTTSLALATATVPTFASAGAQPGRLHDRSHSISHTALSSIHAAQRSFSSRAAKLTSAPAPMPVSVPVPSPPRPALISQISAPRGVQYEGRMVFDPVKMTWLKAARPSNDPLSPSELEDEEDPFAGLEDLKDDASIAGGNTGGGVGSPNPDEPSFVGEEFDVGPGFIQRQQGEEAIWRRRVEGWVGGLRDNGEQRGGWRWAIRDFAASASAGR